MFNTLKIWLKISRKMKNISGQIVTGRKIVVVERKIRTRIIISSAIIIIVVVVVVVIQTQPKPFITLISLTRILNHVLLIFTSLQCSNHGITRFQKCLIYSGLAEGLSVGTEAGGWICRNYPLHFQRVT